MNIENIFRDIPAALKTEVFENVLVHNCVRIERILSQGHTSPETGWYDQEENEWVVVLQGKGTIEFEDGSFKVLAPGDYLNIPAHQKHKVSWTDPEQVTVWLAVFYPQ